jgi:serine/threonine protein kinase
LRHAIAKGFFSPGALRNHWEVVLNILSQVAAAVEYLHSKRICHGDLNPSNVLFKVRHKVQ